MRVKKFQCLKSEQSLTHLLSQTSKNPDKPLFQVAVEVTSYKAAAFKT